MLNINHSWGNCLLQRWSHSGFGVLIQRRRAPRVGFIIDVNKFAITIAWNKLVALVAIKSIYGKVTTVKYMYLSIHWNIVWTERRRQKDKETDYYYWFIHCCNWWIHLLNQFHEQWTVAHRFRPLKWNCDEVRDFSALKMTESLPTS